MSWDASLNSLFIKNTWAKSEKSDLLLGIKQRNMFQKQTKNTNFFEGIARFCVRFNWIARDRSFVKSDVSESLTALKSEQFWAKEIRAKEWIPNPYLLTRFCVFRVQYEYCSLMYIQHLKKNAFFASSLWFSTPVLNR